jgi:predicted HTH transcriptional regulator
MQPFPDLSSATTFPFPESSWLEFKEALSKCVQVRIRETICGLLNIGGGYIVIGVRDCDRYILGVSDDKTADSFQLRVDDIYHQGIVVIEDGKHLPPGAVVSAVVSAAEGKKLLVITVKPEAGQSYRMRDGTRWFRLSVSNYRLSTEFEHQREIEKLRTRLHEVHQEFLNLAGAAKEAEQKATASAAETELLRKALYESILEKKEGVEEELKRRWYCLC